MLFVRRAGGCCKWRRRTWSGDAVANDQYVFGGPEWCSRAMKMRRRDSGQGACQCAPDMKVPRRYAPNKFTLPIGACCGH
jgi:hypothetical protein